MVIGGLNKLASFLRSQGAIDLSTGTVIPFDRYAYTGTRYRLSGGAVVEVIEAPVSGYAKAYGFACSRFTLAEVA